MKEKKVVIRISCLMLLVVLCIGGAYAWYSWSTTEEQEKSVTVTIKDVNIRYSAGDDINISDMIPVTDKEKGVTKDITIGTASTTDLYVNLAFNLTNLDNGLKHSSLRWAMYEKNRMSADDENAGLVSQGNMAGNKAGDSIALLSNTLVPKTDVTYRFYLWIDGKVVNPSTMYNQNIQGYLQANVTSETPTAG